MSSLFFPISDLSSHTEKEFGGKALQLAMLNNAGFEIPDGFCMPADQFERYCGDNSIKADLDSTATGHAILEGTFSEAMLQEIRAFWKSSPFGKRQPIVIRSSALDEDGAEFSFAGIFESILNIRNFNELIDAIRKVWSSYYSESAISYRKRFKLVPKGIGIIVQLIIEGDQSGVIFTDNPTAPGGGEIVIEAHPGLNFAAVNGSVQCDRYVIDRNLTVRSSTISSKSTMYKLGLKPSSFEALKMNSAESDKASLQDQDVLKLAKLGIDVESVFKEPIDLEWTIAGKNIFLLQARPVTTLQPEYPAFYDSTIQEDAECTMLDRYATPASVCYLSLLERWQQQVYLSFYHRKTGACFSEFPLHFYFNRVYWNLKYQRNYFEDLPFGKKGLRHPIKLLKLLQLIRSGHSSWYARLPAYHRILDEFWQIDLHQLTQQELMGHLNAVIERFCNFIGKDHYQFLGLAQVCYNLLINRLAVGDNYKELVADILESRVSNNMTIVSNAELEDLVSMVVDDPTLNEMFTNHTNKEIFSRINKDDQLRKFRETFNGFIERHGHRGTACDDLMYPHWREDPALVVKIIKQLSMLRLKTNDSGVGKLKSKKKDSKQKIAELYRRHSRFPFLTKVQQGITGIVAKYAAIYMNLRENQRYYFDKSWILLRSIMLHLEKQIGLANQGDIFHLTIDEISNLVAKNSPIDHYWQDLIEYRKQVFTRNEKLSSPYTIKNNRFLSLQTRKQRKSYKAIGISAGQATGKLRIIKNLDDLPKIETGEIAVVSTFHPSWTPILRVVSGLIMDYGNILSHGAVVAREYRIPVVVFNDAATQLFSDGQWAELDGTKGRLRVLNMAVTNQPKQDEAS